MSRRAGIISALPAEADCYAGALLTPGLHTTTTAIIHVCGMGAARAAQAARETLQQGARCLISWGTAAALDPQLRSGDIIVPRCILIEEKTISVDDALSAELRRLWRGDPLHDGPLWQSPALLHSADQKQTQFIHTGAMAADMESGAIAAVAAESGVPFLAVRVILDTQVMVLPAPAVEGVDVYGRVWIGDFLRACWRTPQSIAPLIILAGAYHRARRQLRALAPALQAALATGTD